MCLLTFCPDGVVPDVNALADGASMNPDGHGFAVVAGDRIIVRRGLDAEQVVEEFIRVRDAYPNGPALFHSRLATHGTVSKQNCHPFRMGRDRRTVLAHNGILPDQVRPVGDDIRCDTRIAAEDYLPHDPFGSLDSPAGSEALRRWLGPTNKMVILTVDPRYRNTAYLLNEDCGFWHNDGAWYSNTGFLASDLGRRLLLRYLFNSHRGRSHQRLLRAVRELPGLRRARRLLLLLLAGPAEASPTTAVFVTAMR
jgi:hypothetical protein